MDPASHPQQHGKQAHRNQCRCKRDDVTRRRSPVGLCDWQHPDSGPLIIVPAHTKGDELILVEPDGTLVSGDVVQNKVVPNIFGDGGTPSSWIAVLDKVSALNVRHVLPDHSAPGDGSLVTQERAFIDDLRTRALALKAHGVSAGDAGKQLSAEFKTKYSDWPNMNVAGFVRSVFAE
jgi:hypothetical protein